MDKILVIEDEVNIRETLQDMLELSGFEVSIASNGKIGYDMILSEEPDLVLCDINMPELDGFSLLEAVSNRLKDKIIPVFLFLTAKVETKEIRYGMDLGADDYILKPFNNSQIIKSIKLRLEKRKKILTAQLTTPLINVVKKFSKLSIPTDEGMDLVPIENIVLCRAERAYCTFQLKDGKKILVSKPMKEFEDILITNGFFKVHKSTIVNLNFAKKYIRGKGGCLVLSDGTNVAVSIRKKEELMNLLKYNLS